MSTLKNTVLAPLMLVIPFVAFAQVQQPAASPRPETGPDYEIGAGDLLQVFVWKEPELTRDVTVRSDGKISVPLLGDVAAAGLSPQSLGEELARGLARFVETPRVTIVVSQAISSRFYVLGQVGKPGEFRLNVPTTVLQGLALAGGFREFAKTDDIVIIRQQKGPQMVIPVNYKKLSEGKDVSQNVMLKSGDTIVVP